jgi:lipid II:glycine glycyltransferase (peptidoglycan interpeptide bridge formation enzyme)
MLAREPIETFDPAGGYTAEVDAVPPREWCEQVAGFSDANLYQLWHAAADAEPSRGASRLLLRRRGQVVAAAEVRLFTVPFTTRGIAYVRWGPLWRRRGGVESSEVLRQALRTLHDEYVRRRRMVLRIVPRLTLEEHPDAVRVAADEGFARLHRRTPDRTLVLPLHGDLAELRQNLAQKWRNHLNKAEKAGLSVIAGSGLDLFDEFAVVYGEMLRRKGFAPTADLTRHRRLQEALPDNMKMGVLLARHDGRSCAGVIYSALGDTALYLFGATNEAGMRTSASYLLQWETVQRLKARGLRAYDLHGINPESNPGTYSFKKGLAGKTGVTRTFVGPLQACRGSLTDRALLWVEATHERLRAARAAGVRRRSSPAGSGDARESER